MTSLRFRPALTSKAIPFGFSPLPCPPEELRQTDHHLQNQRAASPRPGWVWVRASGLEAYGGAEGVLVPEASVRRRRRPACEVTVDKYTDAGPNPQPAAPFLKSLASACYAYRGRRSRSSTEACAHPYQAHRRPRLPGRKSEQTRTHLRPSTSATSPLTCREV